MNPSIPSNIAAIVVIGSVAIATAIWSIFAWASRRSGLPRDAARRVRIGAALFLGAWLGAVLWSSPRFVPFPPPEVFDPVSIISLMFAASVGLFGVLAAISPSLRRVLAAIPLPALHAMQSWRIMGFAFIVLLAQGRLPAHFALPAGWGDVFVGLTAPFVALALARRARGSSALAVAWNVFGLTDLLVAVGMGSGVLAMLLIPGAGHVPPAAAMGALPMILVPTFAVPASLLIHVLALARLRSPQLHAVPTAARPEIEPADRVYSSHNRR
jgi:hypothetical protein